jgi:hypothetical protein
LDQNDTVTQENRPCDQNIIFNKDQEEGQIRQNHRALHEPDFQVHTNWEHSTPNWQDKTNLQEQLNAATDLVATYIDVVNKNQRSSSLISSITDQRTSSFYRRTSNPSSSLQNDGSSLQHDGGERENSGELQSNNQSNRNSENQSTKNWGTQSGRRVVIDSKQRVDLVEPLRAERGVERGSAKQIESEKVSEESNRKSEKDHDVVTVTPAQDVSVGGQDLSGGQDLLVIEEPTKPGLLDRLPVAGDSAYFRNKLTLNKLLMSGKNHGVEPDRSLLLETT